MSPVKLLDELMNGRSLLAGVGSSPDAAEAHVPADY